MTNRVLLSNTDALGVYSDRALAESNATIRYTVFANFDLDGFIETEEIDVDAASPGHAREIAEAALARDYEPGGKVVHVEELQGVLIYSGVLP